MSRSSIDLLTIIYSITLPIPLGEHVSDNDLELQLTVWKEMAITKQHLMLTATNALKLDEDCSQDELKVALEAAIKRSIEADADISHAEEQAQTAVSLMEKKLQESKNAQDVAEAAQAEAEATQQKIQKQIDDDRDNSAKELKNLKASVAEKERSLKAINTALSDTPENILKKLKTLKKQKMDESNARKLAEKSISTLRKEKKELEQTIEEMQAEQKDESLPAEKGD